MNVTLLYFVLCAFFCHNYYDFPADIMMRTILGCIIVMLTQRAGYLHNHYTVSKGAGN